MVLVCRNLILHRLYSFCTVINFSVNVEILLSFSFGTECHFKRLVGILSSYQENEREILVNDASDKLSLTSRVIIVMLRVILNKA